ncbi:MAG: acyl-CoA thioesterase [Planctomycetota bacterium]|nr:MAG: acyl-CoA thioesterase [Planctomycetota bacterium]
MRPQPSGHPPPPRPIPRAGVVELRVRYCECDPMGVAHHSAYIPWLEVGRTELLRASGLSYAQLEQRGLLLAVVKLEIRYRAPARYDDLIAVHTHVTGGGRARINHAYEVRRAADSAMLAVASSTLACLDAHGKPQPLPDWLTAAAHVELRDSPDLAQLKQPGQPDQPNR